MSETRMATLERLEAEERERIAGYERHNRREHEPLDPDFEEQATQRENDDVVNNLLEGAWRRLEQVIRARTRLEEGRGEVCEMCGGGIDPERLAALPATTLCRGCAHEAEP